MSQGQQLQEAATVPRGEGGERMGWNYSNLEV